MKGGGRDGGEKEATRSSGRRPTSTKSVVVDCLLLIACCLLNGGVRGLYGTCWDPPPSIPLPCHPPLPRFLVGGIMAFLALNELLPLAIEHAGRQAAVAALFIGMALMSGNLFLLNNYLMTGPESGGGGHHH